MEMVLSNGFCTLSNEECYMIDGGFDLIDFIGSTACGYVVGKAGSKVGAAIGGTVGGPIGAVIGGVIGVAAFEIVYHLNN